MNRKIYGYARVSSTDQNLQRQIELLSPHVENPERDILLDKASGKNFDRKAYNSLVGAGNTLPLLRGGDLLVIVSLDRLGRNYTEIREQWQYIVQTLKADIKVLDMPLLDTSTTSQDLDRRFIADLVLQILSYTAEKERENIRKRQRQGIDIMPEVNGKKVSGKTGRATGRPKVEYPPQWDEIYTRWQAGDITAKVAMDTLQIKRSTFYNLVRDFSSNI